LELLVCTHPTPQKRKEKTDEECSQFDKARRTEWSAEVVELWVEYYDGVESAEVYDERYVPLPSKRYFFRWSTESVALDVIAKDLEAAVKMPNSPFVRCQPYFPYFYKYGEMYGGAFFFLSSLLCLSDLE
jgi:hypothetical protein